jgi:hypothetical protein
MLRIPIHKTQNFRRTEKTRKGTRKARGKHAKNFGKTKDWLQEQERGAKTRTQIPLCAPRETQNVCTRAKQKVSGPPRKYPRTNVRSWKRNDKLERPAKGAQTRARTPNAKY